MPGIQDFVSMATSQLGISEDNAKSATGSLLSVIGEKAGKQDFQSLLGALPGAEALVGSGAPAKSSGMMGAISNLTGGALGGKLGAAAGLLGQLKGSGLSLDQAGSFVSMFADFAKKNVDGALISRILEKVPDLKKVMS